MSILPNGGLLKHSIIKCGGDLYNFINAHFFCGTTFSENFDHMRFLITQSYYCRCPVKWNIDQIFLWSKHVTQVFAVIPPKCLPNCRLIAKSCLSTEALLSRLRDSDYPIYQNISLRGISFCFCSVGNEIIRTSARNRSISYRACANHVSMSLVSCFVMSTVYTQLIF